MRGHLQRDRGLRKVREQAVKWTTEGAGNETKSSVFCDVRRASDAMDIIVHFVNAVSLLHGISQAGHFV